MKIIKLTQNKETIIDNEYYQLLNKYKWQYHHTGDVIRGEMRNGKYKILSLHREIMNAVKGEQVDHINHNRLDNRKCNLRICTKQQNSFNRKGNLNSKSKYKGVWWYESLKRWQVYITYNKKHEYLGVYKDIREAAKAYNEAAIKYFGEFAYLNKI